MIKYLFVSIVLFFSFWTTEYTKDNIAEIPLTTIQEKLGKSFDDRRPDFTIPGTSVESGRSIVHEGFGINTKGKKTRKQSKHFMCTSCHNTVKEDPNLAMIDAQARLDYTYENGLPYLQGSPLYGAINRETFYNGDYYLKYGDLVKPAKNNIREAIQLCAMECAQGRALKDWEIESVLAYLWEIGIKMKDLDLSEDEMDEVLTASNKEAPNQDVLDMLSTKYQSFSPATFVKPPQDRKAGNGLTGDPENGMKLYETSCLHCHKNGRYSYLHLNADNLTVRHLRRTTKKYHRHSIYQVTRWGVPVKSGKPSYMPQYTLEKMTEQQLADLVAFVDKGY